MKKAFISALITFFFLENTSKEVNEKTNRASWFRTLVYFTLTIIFGIFFYRSFQVTTITNSLEISTLRCAVDSLDNPQDTIKQLTIGNWFFPLGSYKNPIVDDLAKDGRYSENGGVEICFQHSDSATGVIKNRSGLNNSIKTEIESKTGKEISAETGEIYHLDFMSTSLPRFFPLFPIERFDLPNVTKETDFSKIEHIGNLNRSGDGKVLMVPPSEDYTVEGLSYEQTIVAHDQNTKFTNLAMPHPHINTMDIFSACDLSQYTFNLFLKSDMYIKQLVVAYNVPVELSNQADGVFASANAFGIKDANILNEFVEGAPMTFLVKFPTMANLQQIRTLILTAIVTALLSLFCTNLFYRLRKITVNNLTKKRIDYTDEEVRKKYKVKDFKSSIYSFICIVLIFALIAIFLGLFGYTFLIDFKNDFWIIAIILILVIVVIPLIIYFNEDLDTLLTRRKGAKKPKKGQH